MSVFFGTDFESTLGLDQIETDWSMVHEPAHVVLRYAQAIQRYLHAIITHRHDAEEVAQDLLLWVTEHGLPHASKDRGRFRDYLKQVVRNAAFSFLRRRQADKHRQLALVQTPDPAEVSRFDREWLAEWRQCLLDRVWERVRKHQQRSKGNLAYTVLRLRVQHPDDDTVALAKKTAGMIDKPIRADALRQQLSRGRQLFARSLVKEVALTLDDPTPADVEAELADLGLMEYVREFLPLRRHDSKR